MHRAPALLGLILLAPASAHAVDLSTSLEIWFQSWTGAGGNTGGSGSGTASITVSPCDSQTRSSGASTAVRRAWTAA